MREVVIYIFMVILQLAIVLCAVLFVRNKLVYRHKNRYLALVNEACKQDIANDKSWMWRFDALRTVSYDKLLFMFWRSFDSFYPDKSFLDPNAQEPDDGRISKSK